MPRSAKPSDRPPGPRRCGGKDDRRCASLYRLCPRSAHAGWEVCPRPARSSRPNATGCWASPRTEFCVPLEVSRPGSLQARFRRSAAPREYRHIEVGRSAVAEVPVTEPASPTSPTKRPVPLRPEIHADYELLVAAELREARWLLATGLDVRQPRPGTRRTANAAIHAAEPKGRSRPSQRAGQNQPHGAIDIAAGRLGVLWPVARPPPHRTQLLARRSTTSVARAGASVPRAFPLLNDVLIRTLLRTSRKILL